MRERGRGSYKPSRAIIMPGLFGYAVPNGSYNGCPALGKMRDLLIYRDCGHKSEAFFCKDGVNAGCCAPDFENADERVYESSGTVCWFDGEIYNAYDLNIGLAALPDEPQSIPRFPASPASSITAAYISGGLENFLRDADGCFSAVIYDSAKRRITLITDRYGFRHLYYSHYNGKFCWASEYKAFLAMPDFKIDINRQSVDEFMKFGGLCGDRTWFDGVFLLNPATVLTYDMRSGLIHTERYWSPDEIRPFTGKIDIEEYSEEWGRLFRLSVAERAGAGERVGVALGGGLGSRAVLAAMPPVFVTASGELSDEACKINAVTVCGRDRRDIRFAAAALKGAKHHIFHLNADGWFERAAMGVWAADAARPLSTLFGIEHFDAFSNLFDVCLSGGGAYEFDGIGTPAPQTVRRRLPHSGFRLGESFFKVRMPFFDNALYEFTAALPRPLLKNGVFLQKAFSHNFGPYYSKNLVVNLPPFMLKAGAAYKKTMSALQRFGFPARKCSYISEMFRHEGNRRLAESILSDKNAVYPDYISTPAPADFAKGRNMETVCRILTFEIWMRMVGHIG